MDARELVGDATVGIKTSPGEDKLKLASDESLSGDDEWSKLGPVTLGLLILDGAQLLPCSKSVWTLVKLIGNRRWIDKRRTERWRVGRRG